MNELGRLQAIVVNDARGMTADQHLKEGERRSGQSVCWKLA
jgi:hypothetical protein